MSGRASDATRAGPGPLEVSFTFQPGNGRNNGCRHTDQDRNVEDASRASSLHRTQKEAAQVAKEMLRNQGGGELTTTGRDGKIRSKDTIAPGNDPNPPKLLPRMADGKRLPFAVQVPNATTVKAMKELDEGKGKRFGSAEELFQDLGI